MLWGSHTLKRCYRFKSNWTSVKSDQGSGRPQTAQNTAVVEKRENLIMKDRYLTVPETTEQIEITSGSPYAVLCYHVQSDCEICSQASVGGTERILLVVTQDLQDTINAKSDSL
ncbi:hypothetical protein TNCV_634561 [Trichonephila clavipes]|nr:hypothetical protein TNCV_634561 [Trichonephila clavipes]